MSCRSIFLKVLVMLALLGACPRARALTNGVALLPPMGFNSWYGYGSSVNEALIKSIADTMRTNGMLAAGYTYINLDDGWASYRDTNGVIVADTNKFPDGMAALAAYVHADGFKIGLYTAASSNTCADFMGSMNHIVQDANTYASWGIDYVKYEGCNVPVDEIYPRGPIYCARMSQALLHCGRPIVFSFSIGGVYENWMKQYINLWRGTGDINGEWSTILSHIDFVSQSPQAAGPGGWNDADVIEIGTGMLSTDECISTFSMWCMLNSPLLVPNAETTHTNYLCNMEAVAVDQDPGCIQGICVWSNNNTQVWNKPLGSSNSGTNAVALLNRGEIQTNITAYWTNLGFAPGVCTVWDMWAHAYIGNFTNSYTANLPLHGTALLKIVNGATMPWPAFGTDYVSHMPWMAGAISINVYSNNYPFAQDLSGALTEMSLRGNKYTNGLGMNQYTTISYFLGGIATQFQANIGIDDIAGNFGSMIFSVYGDNNLLYQSPALTTQSPVQSLNLNVSGITKLTLVVTNAIANTADDFADWANARLICAAVPPATPGGLGVTPSSSQLALSWYAQSGATGYILKRATTPGGPYTAIATNAGASYIDTNIAPGVTYFYVVSAINANGASTNSTEIDATLPAYWTNTITGTPQSWNVSANWTNTSGFPNRMGGLAIVTPAIAAPQTNNLNQNITLGGLVMGVTNGSGAITLAGNGGTLTFDNESVPATFTDFGGVSGDTLSAPMVLNHNLAVTTISSNMLIISGLISGAGSFTANGPGPLLLSGSNSFAGPATVNGGLTRAGSSNAFGAMNGGIYVSNTGTLDVNGFNCGAEPVVVSGAGYDGNGAIISSAAAPQTNAFRSLTLAGSVILGGTGRWDVRGTNTVLPSGVFSTGGNGYSLTKNGGNEISLASLTVDPALGDIDINQGTLSFENATTSLGDPAHTVNVQAGATLAFTQTTNSWNKNFVLNSDGVTPSISGSGSNVIVGAITVSNTCVLGVTTGTLALNGPISGNATLIKQSTGTLILAATNAGFGGQLIVAEGTLTLQNTSMVAGVTQIIVEEGATLDVSALPGGLILGTGQSLSGGGIVNGNVTIGAGATLEPDSAFGVPSFNDSLSFAPGSICILEVIGDPPFTSDNVHVEDNLGCAGALIVSNLLGTEIATNASFRLFSAGSYSGQFDAIEPIIPGQGLVWDTRQINVNGVLAVANGYYTQFESFAAKNGSIVLSGVNGNANGAYYLLTSSNALLPPYQWTVIATNHFDNLGNFSITISNNGNTNANVFYRLAVPY